MAANNVDQRMKSNDLIAGINKANEYRKVKLIAINPEVIEEFVKLKAENNHQVNKESSIRFLFKCENGHEDSLTTYSKLMDKKYECKTCSANDRKIERIKLAFEQLSNTVGEYNYPNFFEEYDNPKSKITCICPIHGEFKQYFSRLMYEDKGCAQCSKEEQLGNYRLPNVYIDTFKLMNVELTDIKKRAKQHQEMKCLCCNSTFSSTPIFMIRAFNAYGRQGCTECKKNERFVPIRQASLEQLKLRFDIMEEVDLVNLTNMTKLLVRNKECGHTFRSKYGNLANKDVKCGVCNIMRDKYTDEMHYISTKNKEGFDQYKSEVEFLTERNYTKYINEINPNNYSRELLGREGYQLDHIISKVYCFNAEIPAEVCAHKDNLRMIDNIDNVKKGGKITSFNIIDEIPDIFYEYFSNSIYLNKEFVEFIKELDDNIFPEYFVDKYKLSAYSEDKNIGFVLATFSEYKLNAILSKNYFSSLQKFFKDKKDMDVIIIYEDEWKHKKDIVKSKIKYFMKQSDAKIINARDCQIKLIESDEKINFLNTHHIQGTCKANIAIGAYHNEELVAVMTFDKTRIFMEKNSHDKRLELVRFATHSDYLITGIGQRLFKFFINFIKENNHPYDEIISYADKRWSTGKLYNAMGFEMTADNKPNYDYISDGERKHRFAYSKARIKEKFPEVYDEKLTEEVMMEKVGIPRIYNAGILTYVYKLK